MRGGTGADEMQAALFFLVLFPPPPPGAFRLARRNRAGARRAADRQEILGVQRVDRNVMRERKCVNGVPGPIEQRAQFQEIAVIDSDKARALPVSGLVRAQPDNPGRRSVERD